MIAEVVNVNNMGFVIRAIHHAPLTVHVELVEVPPLSPEPMDTTDGRPVRIDREIFAPEVGDLVLNTGGKPGERFPDFFVDLDTVRRRLISR